MKNTVIAILFLFFSVALCFGETECVVSQPTLDNIIQLKHYMDTYARNAFKETNQFGSGRRDYFTQILNYAVIISEKMDYLLSALDEKYAVEQGKYVDDLSSREIIKFIDFLLGRMKIMKAELDRQLKSTNEVMLIHHIESVSRFFSEGKAVLSQAKGELSSCKQPQ